MVDIPENESIEPPLLAYRLVFGVMAKGSSKDGSNDSWKEKPTIYHFRKFANHAMTAFLMYCCLIPKDDEEWDGHLKNAITRALFIIWQLHYQKL